MEASLGSELETEKWGKATSKCPLPKKMYTTGKSVSLCSRGQHRLPGGKGQQFEHADAGKQGRVTGGQCVLFRLGLCQECKLAVWVTLGSTLVRFIESLVHITLESIWLTLKILPCC